jgi:chromosome segregation ATPase
MSAYVEIVFDNTDGRFPVGENEDKADSRLGRMKLFCDEQSG